MDVVLRFLRSSDLPQKKADKTQIYEDLNIEFKETLAFSKTFYGIVCSTCN